MLDVLGIKYSLPGRTSLTELICADTCLILSNIVLLSSHNMILLCLPINSVIKCLRQRSPNSSKCSISISIIRSKAGCVIDIIRPLLMCFLRNITKLGASWGLGLLSLVIYASGSEAFADNTSLYCPELAFMVSKSSSFSGSAILYNLPPRIVLFKSCTIFAIVIPSNAIILHSDVLVRH